MVKGRFCHKGDWRNGGKGLKLLMVAGGTGGHITPAIALGSWRKALGDEVSYICGNRPLELEIYGHHGIEPRVLPLNGSPLGVSRPLSILRRLGNTARSFFLSARIILKESPDLVLLFGGYVSLPVLLMGLLMGEKIIFHEQNAVAGKVTRLAYRLGVTVATGWKACKGVKGVFTGVPVRKTRPITRDEALSELGIDRDLLGGRRIISILGGSLGNSSLMDSIVSCSSMVESVRYLCIYPGEAFSPSSELILKVPRSWDMSAIYAVSDLVISRAGGATLAEISFHDIPAIVVPWLNASDGHQAANAACFAALRSSGWVWNENDGFKRLLYLIKKLSSFSRSSISFDCEATYRLWRLVLSHI